MNCQHRGNQLIPSLQEPMDDRLAGMLPKEGRKKATERLKQYEREIAELDKKKSALDHMVNVSREKVR